MNIFLGGVDYLSFSMVFEGLNALFPSLHSLFNLFDPLMGCVLVIAGKHIFGISLFSDSEAIPFLLHVPRLFFLLQHIYIFNFFETYMHLFAILI